MALAHFGRPQSRRGLVAIGFAEALSAPETAWSLAEAGFEVIAFSRKGRRTALRHSRYVTVFEITAPESDCAAALRELAALLNSQQVKSGAELALLPLDDASVWLSCRVRPASQWTLAGASGDCAELALDKQKQIQAAVQAGLRTPATSFVSAVDELDRCVQDYPVIVRPAFAAKESKGRLRKGRNWICSNEEELQKVRSDLNGAQLFMVQPFLEGVGEGVFGFATEHGVLAWSCHRRVRMINPHGSGSSACRSQEVPEELKGPITAFIASCGWRGMFMIELLRTRDGQRWFVEFNGRAWGSMALARRQLLEYPAWTVELALKPQFTPGEPGQKTEGLLCRNLGREFVHLLFVLRGPQSRAIRSWPPFWSTLVAFFKVGRDTSFYNWRADDWRVFVYDSWYTICEQLFKSGSAP